MTVFETNRGSLGLGESNYEVDKDGTVGNSSGVRVP